MFLLILAAIVSGDVVRINTVITGKPVKLMMGGAEQTITVDAYGRMTWMDNPTTNVVTLMIGDDAWDLRTSRTGAGYNGCNYNFDIFGDNEMYQNSGMECTKVFEKAPGAIELINDVGKKVYPAFNVGGWGFASDSVLGWLDANMIAVYTAQNPYLVAIGVKEGSEVEVGYYDQIEYKSCGQAVVGQEFIKNLADCVGTPSTESALADPSRSVYWDSPRAMHPGLLSKESKVGEPSSNMNTDARYSNNYMSRSGHAETAVGKQCTKHSDCEYWELCRFGQGCMRRPSGHAESALADLPRSVYWDSPRAMHPGLLSKAFQTSTRASYSADDCAVYAFAAFGIAALAQQAYKMVVKKNHETMPIYSEV